MKGDFTRFGFDPRRHYSLVLHQQGRVALDADSNEASVILLRHIRLLTRDLFGDAGGPPDSGFSLSLDTSANPPALMVSPGHYYVHGTLCENEQWVDYASQPDWTPAPPVNNQGGDALLAWLRQPAAAQAWWVYLDVWDRHVTWIEDDSIREPALGGPDTCTRAKVVWQVKALPWDSNAWGDPRENNDACNTPMSALPPQAQCHMSAQLDPGATYTDACIVSPGAAYRGAENQLYRVEVHRGGTAGSGSGGATFKWSRDNGSVATRWLGVDIEGDSSALAVTSTRGFSAGDWVELSDDALDLMFSPGQLVRVSAVDGDRLVVDTSSVPGGTLMAWSETLSNPKVRRWDQRGSDLRALDEGAVPIVESTGTSTTWLDLEDGIQVAFASGGTYRTGDYWVIPARVATQNIEWPPHGADGAMQPPLGVNHAYAPLGVLMFDPADGLQVLRRCKNCLSLGGVECTIPDPPTGGRELGNRLPARPAINQRSTSPVVTPRAVKRKTTSGTRGGG